MSENILLITYNFIPNSPTFGSVARCTYLYKHLKNHGFGVNVLSVGGKEYGYFGHDDLEIRDLHYVESKLKRKKQQQFNAKGKKADSFLKSGIKSVLKFFNNNLMIPDYSITSIFSVYYKAIELIDTHNASSVIISAPPHGLSLVLLLLKRKRPNINFIVEYRDSWNTQPIFKKSNYISNKISLFLEKKVLNTLDTLVYVSPVVPALILDELGVDVSKKSVLIMNGFVPPLNLHYIQQPATLTCIKLAYFGVINDFEHSFRSIVFIEKLLNNCDLTIELDIYGHVEFERFDVNRSDAINYIGSIDHQDVFDKTQQYNYLVILHTDKISSFEPIPGKFFDYIQSRRPIICIMSPDAFISKFIIEHRLGVVFDPEYIDDIDVKKSLDALIFNDTFDFSEFAREVQFNKYVPLLVTDS